MSTAVVVGSGPNGLTCAAKLARAGLEVTVLEAEETIGGGTRSAELTVPGVIHDVCSASHPMGAASPAFRELELERHGLEWRWAEVDLAHPFDDGTAATMYRSIERTAEGLGGDGRAWRQLFGSPARNFDKLNEDALRPILHVPKHPLLLARFGIPAALPATWVTRRWRAPKTQALFAGLAAHAFSPLTQPMSAAVGMAMGASCHSVGWPVAAGGSQSIANALVAALQEHGGKVESGVRVRSLAELDGFDTVVFDLTPRAIVGICGDRLPSRVARAYRRYRHGPAAFKVDLAVEGGVPWAAEECRRAGMVHVAGSLEEMVASERDTNRGRMPERPFVLVGQQYLADPQRSAGDVHPVWAYAHVPNGYSGDGEKAVLNQIERFAPGLRDRIVASAVSSPTDLERHNANYLGGDIIAGANAPVQTLIRPRFALDPYTTGIPNTYICSGATPPGGGVHGMGGLNAAEAAKSDCYRR